MTLLLHGLMMWQFKKTETVIVSVWGLFWEYSHIVIFKLQSRCKCDIIHVKMPCLDDYLAIDGVILTQIKSVGCVNFSRRACVSIWWLDFCNMAELSFSLTTIMFFLTCFKFLYEIEIVCDLSTSFHTGKTLNFVPVLFLMNRARIYRDIGCKQYKIFSILTACIVKIHHHVEMNATYKGHCIGFLLDRCEIMRQVIMMK